MQYGQHGDHQELRGHWTEDGVASARERHRDSERDPYSPYFHRREEENIRPADRWPARTGRIAAVNVVYRLTFKSAVPGAVLRIRWTMSSGYDAIGLYAATLQ